MIDCRDKVIFVVYMNMKNKGIFYIFCNCVYFDVFCGKIFFCDL